MKINFVLKAYFSDRGHLAVSYDECEDFLNAHDNAGVSYVKALFFAIFAPQLCKLIFNF